jgi:ABC-2 type transport system permease protein
VAVVTTIVGGRIAYLPAILGASLGLLLAGYAVSARCLRRFSSLPSPLRRQPVQDGPGADLPLRAARVRRHGRVRTLALPALILGIIAATTASTALGVVTLVVGVVVGVAEIAAGIVVGDVPSIARA